MPATITTTLKDNSKEWADALKKRFVEAGGSAEDFEKTLEGLNNELESRAAQEQAQHVRELADAMDGTILKAKLLKEKEEQAAAAMVQAQRAAIGNNRELQQMDAAAFRAAKQAGTLADYNRDLQQALNDRKVREYRMEIDKLADAMSRRPGGFLGGMSQGFTALKGAALPIAAALFAAVGGAKALHETIQFLAEKGVPAFERLASEQEKVVQKFVEAAGDQRITGFADTMSVGMRTLVIPAVNGTRDTLGNLAEITTLATRKMMDLAGVDFKDQLRQINAENIALKRRNELIQEHQQNKEKLKARDLEAQGIGGEDSSRRRSEARDKEIGGLSEREITKQLAAAHEAMSAARKAMVTANDTEYENQKGIFKEAEQDAIRLENERKNRKQQRLDQEAAAATQFREQQAELARQAFDNELALTESLLNREKAMRDESLVKVAHVEEEKRKLIELNQSKGIRPEDKRANERKIQELNEVLAKEKRNAEEIQNLEKKREKLIEENRQRERELAKDAADLARITHEQEMARLKEKSDKEIEEGLLRLRIEDEIDKFKKQKQAEDDAAYQKKIDQIANLLTMEGKAVPQLQGAGGQGGPGNPNQPQGAPSFAQQLKSMMTPQRIRQQIIKTREGRAAEAWKEEKKDAGEMDEQGNLIDTTGEFAHLSEAEQKRRLKARAKAQESKVRRGARQDAITDWNKNKISAGEYGSAQGDVMVGISEKLISSGNLNKQQIDAIRQVVEELARQNAMDLQLQQDLKRILEALHGLQGGKGNHGGSF